MNTEELLGDIALAKNLLQEALDFQEYREDALVNAIFVLEDIQGLIYISEEYNK